MALQGTDTCADAEAAAAPSVRAPRTEGSWGAGKVSLDLPPALMQLQRVQAQTFPSVTGPVAGELHHHILSVALLWGFA